jgi:hypothetical protein
LPTNVLKLADLLYSATGPSHAQHVVHGDSRKIVTSSLKVVIMHRFSNRTSCASSVKKIYDSRKGCAQAKSPSRTRIQTLQHLRILSSVKDPARPRKGAPRNRDVSRAPNGKTAFTSGPQDLPVW